MLTVQDRSYMSIWRILLSRSAQVNHAAHVTFGAACCSMHGRPNRHSPSLLLKFFRCRSWPCCTTMCCNCSQGRPKHRVNTTLPVCFSLFANTRRKQRCCFARGLIVRCERKFNSRNVFCSLSLLVSDQSGLPSNKSNWTRFERQHLMLTIPSEETS